MKTTNIVSTPNIEGNIGSCTIQSNDAKIGDSIFTSFHSVVQINSCTGKIVGQNMYTDYSVATFIVASGIFLGIVILCIIFADCSNSIYA